MEDEEEPKVVIRRRLSPREKLCPLCLGRLKLVGGLGGWLVPEEYRCDKCGYRGPASLEPSD